MKYFNLSELYRSNTAQARGVNNTPPPEAAARLVMLIERVLDPLRAAFGQPIRVTSGYRSQALNKIVGGAPASQHTQGEAADITAGSPAENRRLLNLIESMKRDGRLTYDQCINEHGAKWIHISFTTRRPNRNQFLTIPA